MLERVVAPAHVVTQEATSDRTGIAVIGGVKNSFWISLFLSKNHRNIVVEAQRVDVEKHLRFGWSADVDTILRCCEVRSLGTNSGCEYFREW